MYRSTPYDVPSVASHKPQSFMDVDTERSISGIAGRPNGPVHPYRSSGTLQTTDDASEAYISRTLYICKLPQDVTAAQISEVLSPFGDIRKITCYPSRQIAFAEFWDLRDAQKARNGLKDVQIGGRQVEIQYSKTRDDRSKEKNTGTLYVRPITTERNFRDPNTLQQYKELFNHYGEVKKVNTNRKREAEKFIEYHDLRSAEAALENLNGMNFNGVRLEVQFANQSSKTINKEGYSSDSGSMNSSKPHYFRKEGGVSHLSMRGGEPAHQGSNILSHPVNYTPDARNTSPYWTGPPIKIHWSGTYGPRAILASDCNSSLVTNSNENELGSAEASRARAENVEKPLFSGVEKPTNVQLSTNAVHTNALDSLAPSSASSSSSSSSTIRQCYSSQRTNCYPLGMSSTTHPSEPWIAQYSDAPRGQC